MVCNVHSYWHRDYFSCSGSIRTYWEDEFLSFYVQKLYKHWSNRSTTFCIPSQHTWPNNTSNAGSGWIQGMDPKELGKPVSEWSATKQYVQTFNNFDICEMNLGRGIEVGKANDGKVFGLNWPLCPLLLPLLLCRKRCFTVPAARRVQQQRPGRWRCCRSPAVDPPQQDLVQLLFSLSFAAFLSFLIAAVSFLHVLHIQLQWCGKSRSCRASSIMLLCLAVLL